MYYVLAVFAVLATLAPGASASVDERERVCIALALASPVPPSAGETCFCANVQECVCDLAGGNCRCQNCVVVRHAATVEERWHAQGWQRDAQGEWFRIVPAAEIQYQVAPVHNRPAFQPGGFSGRSCGAGG